MPDRLHHIAQLLAVRPGEIRSTALASLYHFAFVAAVVLVKSASNALVVARFHAEALPPLYIATALATGGAAALAASTERGRGRRLPRKALLLSLCLLAGLGAASALRLPGAVTALYLFGETFATLLSIRFWGAASELFDARASKRLFGVLGAAGMLGAIAAGLVAQLLGTRVGAVGLLPLAGVSLLACLGLSLVVRRAAGAAPAAATSEREERRQAWAFLRGDRYPRALATLMILLAALTALADYLFRVRAGERFGEDELASLFGALNLWMGVAAVLFQLGLAGRVLERFGIFRYLLVTPGLSAASAVACLFLPGVAPAFALRLIESSGSLSLNPAAFQLLYGPVPDAIRPRIRAAIDGVTKKVGFAAGGALLLVLGGRAPQEALVLALMAVVAAIAIVLGRTRQLYVAAIERRLRRSSGRHPEDLRSAEARQVLLRALAAPDPLRALVAISILESDPRFDPVPHLGALLAHPHERVRAAGVRLAASRRVSQAAPHLERLLADEAPEVREGAALALAKVAPDRAVAALARHLDAPDSTLSSAAIAALLPLDERAAAALRARLERGSAAPARERRETALLLGRIGPSPWAAQLHAHLADEDPAVRAAACEAAGKTGDPALLPALLEILGDRSLRRAAGEALARYGDGAVPALAALLDDRSRQLGLRLQVPRVLRAIGTEAAARALLFSNIQEHAWLRYRIAVHLSRLHEERPSLRVDRERAREAALRRLAWYRHHLQHYRDLEAGLPVGAPLVRAVGDRLQQNLEVTFRLIQLLLPDAAILAAWRRFATGDARERAYAVELLDHLLDRQLQRRLLPLLDRYHRLPPAWVGAAGRPERAAARVRELAEDDDEVLRAIAIHTAIRCWPLEPPLPPGVEEEMDATLMERIFSLEGVEIFAGCDVDDLVALAAIARAREFRFGQVIFDEGDESDALFVILEGQVRFEKGGREVFTVGAGQSFGESSLLDGAPRPVRAVAVSPELHALAIDRLDFLDLVSDRPELLRGIFKVVSRDLRQVLDLAAASAGARGREAG